MYPGEDTFAGNAWGCVSPVLLITPCPVTFEIHLKMFFAKMYILCDTFSVLIAEMYPITSNHLPSGSFLFFESAYIIRLPTIIKSTMMAR